MNYGSLLYYVAIAVAAMVSAVAAQELTSRPVTPPASGVVAVPRLGIEVRNFVQVAGLQPGGPGEVAGLQVDDGLLGIGDTPVMTSKDVVKLFQSMDRGAQVPLVIRRGGKNLTVKLTLDQWAEQSTTPVDKRGRAGVVLKTLLVATNVDGNGLGRRLGIHSGTSIDLPGDPDSLADTFAAAVAARDGAQPLGLVLRNGRERFGAELDANDRPSPVGMDVVYARSSKNRLGVSALLAEAAADAKAFEKKHGNQVMRLAVVVHKVSDNGGYIDLRGDGNFERKDQSVHSAVLRITDPAVKARYAGSTPGQVLYVDAQLRSVQSERVPNTRVDAFLDGPPKEATIPVTRVSWTVAK